MKEVYTLLTSEDKNDIRNATKQIIINQIEKDFDTYDCYLIDPRQIEELVEEVVEECREEAKAMYKDKIMKQIEEKLEM